ncbi:hypothetical protein AK812_SmicGene5894 [Symbiodinium microadriaticum]|uniref:Uncharacterized protein n=1 Tax=Symbiodinium microadriaticum TaxID=2951 RepID=A0A1Q9ESL3_SYMMI|nr:hypothetical protein AK812_SmicGene5894 [Symbiodinium microadriaticum]
MRRRSAVEGPSKEDWKEGPRCGGNRANLSLPWEPPSRPGIERPRGLALLLSQAELRFAARLAPTSSKELSTDLLTQLVETAIPHPGWLVRTQVLEVMAMKLFATASGIDGGDLLLPEAMRSVLEMVEALIENGHFVLVEPCLPPFQDERCGKLAMRFAPDIVFDSSWDLFFDFLIELAATHGVNVPVDLSRKPVLTEAQLASFTDRLKNLQTPVIELQMPPNQLASFTDRLKNLQTPVIELQMPPNQVNALPKLLQLLNASTKSVRSLGLTGNALTESGAKVLSQATPDDEVGPAPPEERARAALKEVKPAVKEELTQPQEAKGDTSSGASAAVSPVKNGLAAKNGFVKAWVTASNMTAGKEWLLAALGTYGEGDE